MNKYNRVTQMDKNEAKKLKTSFNNYKRVLSWNEFNQRIEKKAYLGLKTDLKTDLKTKRSSAEHERVKSQDKPQGGPAAPLKTDLKTKRRGGLCGQTGLEIKEKFNNLWLGDLRSDKKPFSTAINKNEKYSGLKIELKGRLRGAAKSKKLSNIKGSVKSQSIDYYIEYNKKEIYTKWGILGLKIWLIK